MPVELDLAQFPRLKCRRCGLVALVDPELPLDVHPSLTCPNCRRPLLPRRQAEDSRRGTPAKSRRRYDAPPAGNQAVPSSTAVGLAVGAIFVLVLIAAFIWLLLMPHQHYWWALPH